MYSALVPLETSGVRAPDLPSSARPLPVPWRNPHEVSSAELAGHIQCLLVACRDNPSSPDLHTSLGMAYAMNYQVYESIAALEKARQLDDQHFYAQFKYAELLNRLRALPMAERETIKAISLANNIAELSAARRQLAEIRQRIRDGTQKPEWTKPLTIPSVALIGLFLVLCWAATLFK